MIFNYSKTDESVNDIIFLLTTNLSWWLMNKSTNRFNGF